MGTSTTVIIASDRSWLNEWGTERVFRPRTAREARPLRHEAKDQKKRCILPNFMNFLAHKALEDEK